MIVRVCDTVGCTQACYLRDMAANADNSQSVRKQIYNHLLTKPTVLAGSASQFLQHTNSFFLVFFIGHPECVSVLHHFGQHSTTNEHHVLTPWRVFNTNFKFLSTHKFRLLKAAPDLPNYIHMLYDLIY